MVVITNDDADPFARSDASPSRDYVQSFQEHSFLVTKYEMSYIRRRTSITDNTLIIRVRLLFIRLLPQGGGEDPGFVSWPASSGSRYYAHPLQSSQCWLLCLVACCLLVVRCAHHSTTSTTSLLGDNPLLRND